MITKKYETKTILEKRKNPSQEGFWPIAIDIGYSAVKGMSPNSVYSFPAFAKKTSGEFVGAVEADPRDILYVSEDGQKWSVGYTAVHAVDKFDTNDTLDTLYGRNRYYHPMFLVIARVGIALGMIANEHGDPEGKDVRVQTGLPPAYVKADSQYLRDVLCNHHKFDLIVGGVKHHFDFTLALNDIRVMSQPMGSLISATVDNDCRHTEDGLGLYKANVLVFDPGFGTLDTFSIRNRQVEGSNSFDDLGMKEVFLRVAEKFEKKYPGSDIKVHTMQKALSDSYIKVYDRRTRTQKKIPFDDLLEECSKEVCLEALNRIETIYDYLTEYDYLIVTGGTGAAWIDYIRDYFAGMSDTLKILDGRRNDNLPQIFANVRGYYLSLVNVMRKA